jgi:hypothetical protein
MVGEEDKGMALWERTLRNFKAFEKVSMEGCETKSAKESMHKGIADWGAEEVEDNIAS